MPTYDGVILDQGGAVYNVFADGYGITGDGSTDDSGDLNALIASVASTGGVIYFPPPSGSFLIEANVTCPHNVRLSFAPGAVITIASNVTLTINGTVDAGDFRIFDASATGSKVVFGPESGAAVSAAWYGARPGLGTGAADAVSDALNAMFVTQRASPPSSTDGRRVTLRIPPGEYHVSKPIWAGFATAQQQRYYVLSARGATLVATDSESHLLAGKTVFDMTGIQVGITWVDGLRIATDTNTDGQYLPAIGILQMRFRVPPPPPDPPDPPPDPPPAGNTPSSGRGFFCGVEVDGRFQLAAWLNWASEETRYLYCSASNRYEEGQWGFVSQATEYYDVPVHSSVTKPIGSHSNSRLYFITCRFNTNWRGDASDGGGIHLIGPKTPLFIGGFVNPQDGDLCRGPGIRVTQDLAGGGQQPHGVCIRDITFHRTWDTLVQVDANMQELIIENCKGRVRGWLFGSVLKLSEGTTVKGLTFKHTMSVGDGITSFNIEADSDEFDAPEHGFLNDDPVEFIGGTPPGNFTLATVYWIVDRTDGGFKLAATKGGSPIVATNSGADSKIRPLGIRDLASFSVSGNVFSSPDHGLLDGDPISFEGGTPPGGFDPGPTRYYAIVLDEDEFKLSTVPGGSARTASSAGSGTIIRAHMEALGIDGRLPGVKILNAEISVDYPVRTTGAFEGTIRTRSTTPPILLGGSQVRAEIVHFDGATATHEMRNLTLLGGGVMDAVGVDGWYRSSLSSTDTTYTDMDRYSATAPKYWTAPFDCTVVGLILQIDVPLTAGEFRIKTLKDTLGDGTFSDLGPHAFTSANGTERIVTGLSWDVSRGDQIAHQIRVMSATTPNPVVGARISMLIQYRS